MPNCGGQKAAPQPTPYSCAAPGKVIDGTPISATVNVTAAGRTEVTFTLAAPRAVDTPIRVTHHFGVSGSDGPETEASGVIPAGQTTGFLSVRSSCGQADMKAVFTGGNQPAGLVGGPNLWGSTCFEAPPTTAAPATPGTAAPVVPSAPPASVTGQRATPVTPSVGTPPAQRLPETGYPVLPIVGTAVLAIALGVAAIAQYVRSRRKADYIAGLEAEVKAAGSVDAWVNQQ